MRIKRIISGIAAITLALPCIESNNMLAAKAAYEKCNIYSNDTFSESIYTVDNTIEGVGDWTLETVSSGARGTSFITERETEHPENTVLAVNHYSQHINPTSKVCNERMGKIFKTPLSGRTVWEFRLKPTEKQSFNIKILTPAKDGALYGEAMAYMDITTSKDRIYSYYFSSETATDFTAMNRSFELALNEWNDFKIVTDTDLKTFEIYASNSNTTTERVYENVYYKDSIGGFKFEIPRGNPPCIYYVDDFRIYSDRSAQLDEASKLISNSMITNQPLEALTDNIFALPTRIGDNGTFGVKWSSSKPYAVNADTSVVNRRKYTQNVILTAQITDSTDTVFVQNASCTVSIPLTVIPYEGCTDSEILSDFKDNYFDDSFFTDEKRTEITKNLNAFRNDYPDGIKVEWTSDNPQYISENGTVTRPTDGENKTVILSANIIKNNEAVQKSFNFTVLADLSAEQKVNEAISALTYSTITQEHLEYITKSMSLPEKGLYDTKILWSSSKPEVLSPQGVVTRGEKDEKVSLTATVSFDEISLTKSFDFTVKLSENSMVKQDADLIDLSGGTVEKTFKLPLSGKLYSSTLKWSSDSEYIKISGEYAVVEKPDSIDGNAQIMLTVNIINGGANELRYYDFTVPCIETDEALVRREAEKITYQTVSAEKSEEVTQNLAFKTTCTDGVKINWETDDYSVIAKNGEVTRPLTGEDSKTVNVTAEIYKREASIVKEFTFTVVPFENDAQILKRAREELTFAKLSADEITAVRNNLNLPTTWRYGTEIAWKSSDLQALDVCEGENGKSGIVFRRGFGEGIANVILTADISLNENTVSKVFNISVAENAEYQRCLLIDNEGGTLGETPILPIGKWTVADAENSSFVATLDPENSENTVIGVFRPSAAEKPTGTAINRLSLQSSKNAIDGNIRLTLKMFIDEETENDVIFSIRSEGGAQITTSFCNDGTISYAAPDATVLYGKNAPAITRGVWHELRYDIHCDRKRYSLTIDDVPMTDNGCIFDANGAPVDSSDGLTTIYYNNGQKPCNVYGFDISLSNIQTSSASAAYFDDIAVDKLREYGDVINDLMHSYEVEFLSQNDIGNIKKNLVLPLVDEPGYKVSVFTDNAAICTATGEVKRPEVDTPIKLTVAFTDGVYTLYKNFSLNVRAYNPNEELQEQTDNQMLLKEDMEQLIGKIIESNQLSALTDDITLIESVTNKSVVTYQSSNTDVLDNTGEISRQTNDTNVIFTVTLERNGEKMSQALDICVKAAVKVNSAASGSSGVSSGKSKTPVSGIAVPALNKTQIVYFKDVPTQHWAYDYITELYKNGVISSSENFRPNDSILREEFLKLLLLSLKLETTYEENPFDDVKSDEWYAPYVLSARKNGIALGMSETVFGIGENISRQDAAVMCLNAMKLSGVVLKDKDNASLNDIDKTQEYAREAVLLLCANDIITGDENGSFRPNSNISRAEAAAVIARIKR